MLNLAGILTHERFRKWRRVMLFGVFLFAGIANPSPDPITMLMLGGACVVLVEVAEVIVCSTTGAGPGCIRIPTRAWPTTSSPRSTWTTPRPATAGSTDA